jgi:ABC-type Mn2+/Zn2+ transport system permease subunit
MWRGMLASVLAAVPLAVLGVFLYLRRLSLIADALAHVALPGMVLAFLVTGTLEPIAMLAGAAVAGSVASTGIESLSQAPKVRPDAAIGIVFTTLFSVGVILISTVVRDVHIDTQCILFGNVLAISNRALILLGLIAPTVCALVYVFYRWLTLTSFDPTLARNIGIPVTAVHFSLMIGTTVTVVASFEAVGAILAIAMIVVPPATAHQFAKSMSGMMVGAVSHGVVSSVAGMYLSIWINCSTAGAIVVVGGAIYGGVIGLRHLLAELARAPTRAQYEKPGIDNKSRKT